MDLGRPQTSVILSANSCKDLSRGIKRSSCRKLYAGGSVVTKMAAEHLFHTSSNVTYTVTSQRYTSLLEQSIISALQARRCDITTVFMEDGTPSLIARCSKLLLNLYFGEDKIISRQYSTAWPRRFPHLNPYDFWLRRCIKTMIHHDPITSLSGLKRSIELKKACA